MVTGKAERLNGYGVPTYLIEVDGRPVCMTAAELRHWLHYWADRMIGDLNNFARLMMEAAKAIDVLQRDLYVRQACDPGDGDEAAELSEMGYQLHSVTYENLPLLVGHLTVLTDSLKELGKVQA